jgi:hypothetical protein
MEDLLAKDTAILIVSHDMMSIQKYSTQAMLLDQGQCLFLGKPDETVYRYYTYMESLRWADIKAVPLFDNQPSATDLVPPGLDPDASSVSSKVVPIEDWPPAHAFLDLSRAVFMGEEDIAKCVGIALCNEKGQPCNIFQTGDTAYFYYSFQLLRDIEIPIGGVNLFNNKNLLIHGINSIHYLVEAPQSVPQGSYIRFRHTMKLDIAPGEYTFAAALATVNAADYMDIIKSRSHKYPQQAITVLLVMNAGSIFIQTRRDGLDIPFFGYINLKGDFTLSILQSNPA